MTLRSDDWFDAATTTTVPENCDFVQLPLGNVLPLLIDAVRANRGWLDDFIDEEIVVSRDLYELLRFYADAQHPAA